MDVLLAVLLLTPPPVTDVPPVVDTPRADYAACAKAVADGRVVYLTVGPNPQPGDYHAPVLTGTDGQPVAVGRYRCGRVTGFMERVDADGEPIAAYTPPPRPSQPVREFFGGLLPSFTTGGS